MKTGSKVSSYILPRYELSRFVCCVWLTDCWGPVWGLILAVKDWSISSAFANDVVSKNNKSIIIKKKEVKVKRDNSKK